MSHRECIVNPKTGRAVKYGTRTYKKIMKLGLTERAVNPQAVMKPKKPSQRRARKQKDRSVEIDIKKMLRENKKYERDMKNIVRKQEKDNKKIEKMLKKIR